MRRIPSTLILATICIILAEWPSLQFWADATLVHHYLVHGLYLIAGGLVGLQTALWRNHANLVHSLEKSGVSS